ncbi:hypothetical protein B0H10DRAFT_2101374, partial [Mycena sp. CBHHK59/15]
VDEIETLLVEPVLRLKRLDEKISDLQKTLDELAEERDRLSAFVDAHQALISPVRRLPLDIIQEIFVACLPKHATPPILLGRICSAWRSISLSTPRLWASLHVVEPAHPFDMFPAGLFADKLAQRLETTKTWLGRSGQCPLSISLESNHEHDVTPPLADAPPPVHPNLGLFLQALIPFASRWQHINLTISPLALRTMSFLPRATCRCCKPWRYSTASLRRISHSGYLNPLYLPLRWDQLTVLSLVGHGWMLLDILSRCPNLRTCSVLINHHPSTDGLPAMDATVELPCLASLSIEIIGSMAFTVHQLLSRLALPELRHFQFRRRPGSDESLSLAPFLSASMRLESLTVDSEAFSKKSIIALLRCLPPTMQLLGDDVIAILTPSPDAPVPCCPILEELQITHCRAFSDAALLRFINARMVGPRTTLKRVRMHFNRDMEEDIMPTIQPFIDGGLKVSLSYLPPPVWQFSPWQGLADAPRLLDTPWGYSAEPVFG